MILAILDALPKADDGSPEPQSENDAMITELIDRSVPVG